MIALNKKGRPKRCYHDWKPAISPKYEVCDKCGAVRKVEKGAKGA